jgi:hypothetical protein
MLSPVRLVTQQYEGFKMRRLFLGILLCASGPCGGTADALEETLQAFCAQSGIAAAACKCAGDVMRRSMSGNELDVIVRFARSELSTEDIAKLPDSGAALRGKFANSWLQAQTECGVKP